MVSILISDQQARDLLFALDYYILELESQRTKAAASGLTGRVHVLDSMIHSYKETYYETDSKLNKAIARKEN